LAAVALPVLSLSLPATSSAQSSGPSLRKAVYDIRNGDVVYIVELVYVVYPDGTEVLVDTKVLAIFYGSGYLA
jgi:hypothetical protein